MESSGDRGARGADVGADGSADCSAGGPAQAHVSGNAAPHAEAVVDKTAGQRWYSSRQKRARLKSSSSSSLHTRGRGRGGAARSGQPDASVWFRLVDRDRRILGLLNEHKVLTTEQIATAEFTSVRRAQDRLAQLRRLGLLFSFRESYREGGTSQTRFALGYLGARAMAAQRAEKPPTQAAHQRTLERLAWWPKLDHQLGLNGFFCALAGHARRSRTESGEGQPGLMQWWSEQRCVAFFWNRDVKLRPDAYGCWTEGGRWVRFFLEYDTGTETLSKVTRKLSDYAVFPTDSFGVLLFSVHSAKREVALRQDFRRAVGTGRPNLIIATTARDHQHPDGPAGPVWALWNPDQSNAVSHRYRLAELPQRGPWLESHAPWLSQPYSEAAFDPQDRDFIDRAEGRNPASTTQNPYTPKGGDVDDELIVYCEDEI